MSMQKQESHRGRTVVVLAALVILGACAVTRFSPAKRRVRRTYVTWWKALAHTNSAKAYGLMSPEYRETHTQDEFVSSFRDPHGGKLCQLHPFHRVAVHGDSAEIAPTDWWLSGVGPTYYLKNTDSRWYFTGEFDWAQD
jgi:hypothetical protein